MRFCFRVFVLSLIACGFSACSHYHSGAHSCANLPFEKLYVAPAENNTHVPQAQALLTSQLIRVLQNSGITITQCEAHADAVLYTSLCGYSKRPATTLEEDTEIANSFYITLDADISLYNNRTSAFIFENKNLSATINSVTTDSIERVIYQDMPTLTWSLSKKIRNFILEVW